MTTNDPFERQLRTWLREEATGTTVRDHLAEVLVETVATRQRAWWSSLERWLPMDIVAPTGQRAGRPIAVVVLVAALVMALLATAILAAGLSRDGRSVVLPENGRLYVAEAGTLTSYAVDGTDRQVVTELPAGAGSLSFSPDGRSLAYGAHATRLGVVDADDGTDTPIDIEGMVAYAGPIAWAPDGERFLVNAFDGVEEHLYTVARDGVEVREVAAGQIATGQELVPDGWSPRGDALAFTTRGAPGSGAIHVVEGDGAPRRVGTRTVNQYSVSWSPDPRVARLLYVTAGQPATVRILDLDEGTDTAVLPGQWPVWSPDGSRIALWTDGTQVVSTESALAGRPDPEYVFAVPSHTQPGMAPLPGRFRDCSNPDQLSGTEICEPVGWSPDGTSVFGPELGGGAIVIDRLDGSAPQTTIPVTDGEIDVAWRPLPE
jgi:WD40 repeat protein